MSTIYNVEDEVYHYKYGWGLIQDITEENIIVSFIIENTPIVIKFDLNGKLPDEDKISLAYSEYKVDYTLKRDVNRVIVEGASVYIKPDFNENIWYPYIYPYECWVTVNKDGRITDDEDGFEISFTKPIGYSPFYILDEFEYGELVLVSEIENKNYSYLGIYLGSTHNFDIIFNMVTNEYLTVKCKLSKVKHEVN